jgi:flagellar biosynthesis repressor protein FlbT
MIKPIQLWLKAGERIYVNGAVVRVDRKVALELLNDVVFLREAHVLQADETTTPLRQLYFVMQTILMCPDQAEVARRLFTELYGSTAASFSSPTVLTGLAEVDQLIRSDRVFDALKVMRGLFDEEASILRQPAARGSSQAA